MGYFARVFVATGLAAAVSGAAAGCSSSSSSDTPTTSTSGGRTMTAVQTKARVPSVGQSWLADFGEDTPFGPFAAKITFTSADELTFTVTKGAMNGSTDTMSYTATELRPDVFIVRWHEPKSGAYVTHVEDYGNHTVVSSIVNGDQFVEMDGSFTKAD